MCPSSEDSSASGADRNTLTVTDNRTGKEYMIAIENGHFISAAAFSQIKGEADHVGGEREAGHECEEDGLMIYDPSFGNTAVMKSAICYVDGEQGVLLYRGYPIEELLEHSTYLEVAYLLIYGHLPSALQYGEWEKQIMTHTYLHSKLNGLMQSFNYDAHPMGMFISTMAAMSTFHPEANPALEGSDIYDNDRLQNKQIKRIIGKATSVAANAYRTRIGREFNAPQNALGYPENFLYMLDCLDDKGYRPHPVLVEALDKLFIIHAEHEMNCSTAAMLHISSTKVDPYNAVAGAASALYGPLHGGANEAVLRMLEAIGRVEAVPGFIEQVKAKKVKLMGFGHRVYKNYDPRAKLIRDLVDRVFAVCGREPLMEVAMALEAAALSDPYFIERKLYPNVDFYTGLIYKAMGFPTDFFPLLFAIPRTAGWLAHWKEQLEATDQQAKIWRPRQIYTGPERRAYVRMDERNATSDQTHFASDSQAFYKRYAIFTNMHSRTPSMTLQ